jgi:hypothetical protein
MTTATVQHHDNSNSKTTPITATAKNTNHNNTSNSNSKTTPITATVNQHQSQQQ